MKDVKSKTHDDHHEHDHDDELQPQIWTYSVLAASIPLFYMGKWVVGGCFVLLGLLYIAVGSDVLVTKLSRADQLRIQYNIWSTADIVQDLKRRLDDAENTVNQNTGNDERSTPVHHRTTALRTVALAALTALTKKHKPKQQQPTKQRRTQSNSSDGSIPQEKEEAVDEEEEALSHLFQDAAYSCLTSSILTQDDAVVAQSLALLALMAQHSAVRGRYRIQRGKKGEYGLDVVIRCMKLALERAQSYEDSVKEQEGAELQRKACLLLGSLSDGNGTTTDLARLVVQAGGLQAILQAIAWFRFHEPVANWGLWAVFILCYENSVNKVSLLQLQGVSKVLDAMKHHGSSVEVTRHGIAILFDLLRENNNKDADTDANNDHHPNLDIWKVRKVALAGGLHDRLVHALHEFSQTRNMDIRMMAREMLVGTGYLGDIPNLENVSQVS